MPTWATTEQFERDYARLTSEERTLFKRAIEKFVGDLRSGKGFRPGLRVKSMQNAPGIHEVTWEIHDGRATFEYGESMKAGEAHIVWRRVGGHEIFRDP